MLADADITATLPVSDMGAAKQFYGDVLGLAPMGEEEGDGGVTYRSGNGLVYVYPSQYAGTNKGTAAGWSVKDFEEVVNGLREKGVTFERYEDMPDTTLEGDVHVFKSGERAVWFKDPSGNILAVDAAR